MGFKLANGGKFQHAATYAAALAFTAISNATEAVATVVGADLEVGDIVLIESGWSTLNGRVVRVKTATAVSITLDDIDTSDKREDGWWESADNTSLYEANYEAAGFARVDQPRRGDLIVMAIGRTIHPNHAGIYLGDDSKLPDEESYV